MDEEEGKNEEERRVEQSNEMKCSERDNDRGVALLQLSLPYRLTPIINTNTKRLSATPLIDVVTEGSWNARRRCLQRGPAKSRRGMMTMVQFRNRVLRPRAENRGGRRRRMRVDGIA